MSNIFEREDKRPRELCPEGKHAAYLFMVVDCGLHPDNYQGQERIKHQIYLGFEFPEVLMSDGKPFMWGNFYNVTDGKFGVYFAKTSNIHKMLRSWTGKDEKTCSKSWLLGELIQEAYPAFITISHQEGRKEPGKFYAVADSIKPWKGTQKPHPVNTPIIYSPGGDNYEMVPDWLKKKIQASIDPRTLAVSEPTQGSAPPDDDIPF